MPTVTDGDALRVGLIGFGAIGQQVALGIGSGAGGVARVCILVRQPAPRPDAPAPVFTDLAGFLASRPQVVIEAASPLALAASAEAILASPADLVAASGSALLDPGLVARLSAAGRRHRTRVYVPAGAVGGLDVLAAAALADLDAVTLGVVQPGADARLLFQGDALEAVRMFPGSLNVAATTVFVAGQSVTVELRQQPPELGREIELTARGAFGDFSVRLRPRPDPARLSHIVALSLLATLRRLQAPILFG